MKAIRALFILLVVASAACCSDRKETAQASAGSGSNGSLPPLAHEAAVPPDLRPLLDRTFSGDLDQMIERRIIRAGVPFNRTFYFVDQGQQRGLSYEYLMLFQDQLNKQLNTGNLKVQVVPLPLARDALLQALEAGKVDLVVAQLTVTPERQRLVDFTNPTRKNVNEVVVTGPQGPPLSSLADLSGRRVFVRRGSSYYQSLRALNRRLAAPNRPPIVIEFAPESLEDDDLLEMVNAGLIPITVVDDYLANYWKQVLPNLTIHQRMPLRTGGQLAVAIRKNSSKLAAELNSFIAANGLDSAIGRVLSQRYLQSTAYVKNAASQAERAKFLAMVDLFRKYGGQYKFDYLLMAAQGYQESRLDQNAKSAVGAIGVMQLMPTTGAKQEVGDIGRLEPNIHAGIKYMRSIRSRYFEDEPMNDLNRGLFTFASYNAGPARIQRLRRLAEQRGLDPNIWFGNVERVASERIGRETVTYVSNIYKYYIAYRLILDSLERRNAAKEQLLTEAR